MTDDRRLYRGSTVTARTLMTIRSQSVAIPDPKALVHLQFRRFAGCPICQLHLRSIATRIGELASAGMTEVAVFHSSVEAMLRHEGALPFAVVADPELKLYAEFGVNASPRALLDPRAWPAALRGVAAFGPSAPGRGESSVGLPADFLIASNGEILASQYGVHADDQWSVDEILEIARSTAPAQTTSSGIANTQSSELVR